MTNRLEAREVLALRAQHGELSAFELADLQDEAAEAEDLRDVAPEGEYDEVLRRYGY